jgi:pimeloyl-ACP methyl ester carboxylesterase
VSFLRHCDAVIGHDVESPEPAQITFGRFDTVTSTRFAGRLTGGIRGSELVVFEEGSHAPNFECVDEFNRKTLAFLLQHTA